jgi:CRP-like cAMP-binding protein
MADATETLLKAILSTVARQTFSEGRLREIIMPRGSGQAQMKAYNACDGTKTQSDIAKAEGLDRGNFSRTLARWEEAGIIFRLGPDEKPLHVYPLRPESTSNKEKSE